MTAIHFTKGQLSGAPWLKDSEIIPSGLEAASRFLQAFDRAFGIARAKDFFNAPGRFHFRDYGHEFTGSHRGRPA
jgi:hypothetical protein